jgi:hypothetical protein
LRSGRAFLAGCSCCAYFPAINWFLIRQGEAPARTRASHVRVEATEAQFLRGRTQPTIEWSADGSLLSRLPACGQQPALPPR